MSLLGFLWEHWSWLSALGLGGFGGGAWLILGRRQLAWVLWGLAALFLLYTAYEAHRGWSSDFRAQVIKDRDAEWRDKLAAAERDARETIRIREAAAYDAGVKAEAARTAADAKDEAKAAEVVTTIIAASPSARDCTYDAATAAALNSLRQQ